MKQKATVLEVLTIDGPASSGKSTVSKMVATKLGWLYVNTGALYRTLALLLKENNCSNFTPNEITKFISVMRQEYKQCSETNKILLGDRDITIEIRRPDISELASLIAQDGYVRQALLPIQRKVVEDSSGAVVDGRDMGTVVFPNARLKVFLVASVEERARRRVEEIKARGDSVDLEEIKKEIHERDVRDAQRETAPMKAADDAIIIDCTIMNPVQVVEKIISEFEVKKNSSGSL